MYIYATSFRVYASSFRVWTTSSPPASTDIDCFRTGSLCAVFFYILEAVLCMKMHVVVLSARSDQNQMEVLVLQYSSTQLIH